MKKTCAVRHAFVGLLAASALAALVASARAAPGGTLSMRAALSMQATLMTCPPPASATVACYSRSGAGSVSGLGAVSQAYVNVVETAPAGCPPGSFTLLPTTVRLSVAGGGVLTLELAGNSTCSDALGVLNLERSFTVTSGAGRLVGAAGSGQVTHEGSLGSTGATGRDVYSGTLDVPGLEFDVTPPTLSGARSKTVRTPKVGAKRVPVTYAVTARDDVDGVVPVSCSPRSGSRFSIGRTVVSCVAADTSGNAGTARFLITVKKGR